MNIIQWSIDQIWIKFAYIKNIYPENQPIHVHKYRDSGSVVKVVVEVLVSVTVVAVEVVEVDEIDEVVEVVEVGAKQLSLFLNLLSQFFCFLFN